MSFLSIYLRPASKFGRLIVRSVNKMDYQGGPYGYPPYDDDQNASGSDPYAPRSYRDDSAYGNNASPYGQPPAYGQDGGGYTAGASGYPPEQGYTSHTPRASYGGGEGYAPHTTPHYGAENEGYVPRGATGRTTLPREDEGYSAPRSSTGRTTLPREDGYVPRGTTGRTTLPRESEGYARQGTTGRYSTMPGDGDDDYNRAPRPPKNKKKRSKFGKFMHALGLYLAQMPAKTLVIFGGSIAMVLVAVILLAVLLPNSDRTQRTEDGQLALAEVTVTPSLAPTNTPAPTEEASPEPTVAVLTDPIAAAGTKSDLIPDIQRRLIELGYMEEPEGGVTNVYGPSTKMAIRIFQLKNFNSKDSWDGIIGNETYSLLMSDNARGYYLSRGDGDDRTKVLTKLVQDVTDLQNRLITLGYLAAGSATGLYGNSTVLAVQTFQQYHGLDPDGIAGQETLKLIYSTDAMDATTGKANDKSKLSPSPSTSPSTSTTPSVDATTPAP